MESMTKTLSITSGKGGVGKTTLTANLATYLAGQGSRVLILDGDFGLANVDVMFGIKSKGHIGQFIDGEKSLIETITPLAANIDLISGGTGVSSVVNLSPFERRSLVDSISVLEFQYDYLLIDTGPGLNDNVLSLNSAAQEILVVVTPEAASIADAYALIKVLHQEKREKKFSIVCNMVKDSYEGFQLFQRFAEVTHRFLSVGLDYWGAIPMDSGIRKSSINQRLIMKHESHTEMREVLSHIAVKLEGEDRLRQDKSGLQFFWEQFVGVA